MREERFDRTYEVNIHLLSPAISRGLGSDQQLAYSESLTVSGRDQVLSIAAEVAKRAPQALNPYGDDLDSWRSIYFTVLRSNVDLSTYSGAVDEVLPRYGIESFGGELIFSPEMSYQYAYNDFDDLWELVREGYVHGQPDQIIVRFVEGAGGDSSFTDIVTWLLDQGVDVGIEIVRDFILFRLVSPLFGRMRNGRRDRRARRIAAYWHQRNLYHPSQLREFIDTKDTWTEAEVAKRLGLSSKSARQLLRALGLSADSRAIWRPGTSKRSRKRRERWMSTESNADFGLNGFPDDIDKV